MLSFLDLPGELRNLVYAYLIPSPENPQLLTPDSACWAPWKVCKKFRFELPQLHSLLESGAIIPTIDFQAQSCVRRRQDHADSLLPYVASAARLRICETAYSACEERCLHCSLGTLKGRRWIGGRKGYDDAERVLEAWLMPKSCLTRKQLQVDLSTTPCAAILRLLVGVKLISLEHLADVVVIGSSTCPLRERETSLLKMAVEDLKEMKRDPYTREAEIDYDEELGYVVNLRGRRRCYSPEVMCSPYLSG